MKVIKKVFFIATLIWILYTASAMAATATIKIEGARMRSSASTNSAVITIVYQNENVELLTKEGDWYKVKYNEYEGYIREDLLTLKEEMPTEETVAQSDTNDTQTDKTTGVENSKKEEFKETEKQVSVGFAVRIIPSLSASKIGNLDKGIKVKVIQVINNWSCIKYNNKTAWIPNNCLEDMTLQDTDSNEDNIKIGYVAVEEINLREEHSTISNILGTLRKEFYSKNSG